MIIYVFGFFTCRPTKYDGNALKTLPKLFITQCYQKCSVDHPNSIDSQPPIAQYDKLRIPMRNAREEYNTTVEQTKSKYPVAKCSSKKYTHCFYLD